MRSLKKSGIQRDSNPWPPRYRCDALPTEPWSHMLGARSVYWVHIFPCSEVMWSIYEIIHICTAVVYEVRSDHCSKFSNLSNWKWEAWKNQGFNGIRTRDLRDTCAMLYQLSYEATCWERGLLYQTLDIHVTNLRENNQNVCYIKVVVNDRFETQVTSVT